MAVLHIIGSGPGDIEHLTLAARRAIEESTTIIGYESYVDQIRPLINGRNVVSTGMMQEVERCREAIRRARGGETVSLVSGGDAGIYGMAGLVYELLEQEQSDGDDLPLSPEVNVIPGISAVQAAAALLGAPLMHDFSVISLSDLLTPWELILIRLEAAARADFVTVLFNPRSKSRITQIERAREILLAARPATTPVGIVKNACRPGQSVIVTTLEAMLDHDIDMSTLVIIGNSSTFVDRQGHMVTPRGYAGKYGSPPPASPPAPKSSSSAAPEAVMFCGTASDVGKSVITAGFCRFLVRRGFSVAPFKSQNMSLNSFVTPEGGEIGRAQAVQAQACEISPHTDMNPVLLKPNSDTGSQVVIQGRPVGNMSVREYDDYKDVAFEKVTESYQRLKMAYDLIVIEGAGSIAEINLRARDIANLKVALMAGAPVILVADIDRGGVFAQIVGTIELLEPHERPLLAGIIINKFRGEQSILEPGLEFIERRTGVPVLGVLPWMPDLSLPAEDSVTLGSRSKVISLLTGQKRIHIGILKLPRISNFTDFDAFQHEHDVITSYVEVPDQLNGLDVLIIPGSKSTISDLYFLMERGIYDAIARFKGRIVGICGGYQMLGQRVLDPTSMESSIREAVGLGLLPVETEILQKKETHQALAYLEEPGHLVAPECNDVISGYEIHMGATTAETPRPFARIFMRGGTNVAVQDGCVSADGRVFGTYLHGLFDNDQFRETFLNSVRRDKGMTLRRFESKPQRDPFDALAEHMAQHLDMPRLLSICGLDSDPS